MHTLVFELKGISISRSPDEAITIEGFSFNHESDQTIIKVYRKATFLTKPTGFVISESLNDSYSYETETLEIIFDNILVEIYANTDDSVNEKFTEIISILKK
jgi:hypothetical protein